MNWCVSFLFQRLQASSRELPEFRVREKTCCAEREGGSQECYILKKCGAILPWFAAVSLNWKAWWLIDVWGLRLPWRTTSKSAAASPHIWQGKMWGLVLPNDAFLSCYQKDHIMRWCWVWNFLPAIGCPRLWLLCHSIILVFTTSLFLLGTPKTEKTAPKKHNKNTNPTPPFPPHLQGPFLTVKNRVPTTDSTFTTPPGPASLGRTPE